ncbi:hypothetical protein V8G54_019792 [Vigna mungo]|uniref:Uncharacterized protein n=1 Tax=Vigna mungo TaxID=3915 RepID=A0AAQ3NBF8_VIGMU
MMKHLMVGLDAWVLKRNEQNKKIMSLRDIEFVEIVDKGSTDLANLNLTDASHFKIVVCQMTERACHGRERYASDFFYAYSTLLKDLKFQMGVLRELNVAPTQLHPDGCAFMGVHGYLHDPCSLSHSWRKQTAFYKDFKGNFVKVVPLEAECPSFYFSDGQPKFPFYWTDCLKRVVSWAKSKMTTKELNLISQLSQLPLKSSSRRLISFLNNKNLHNNVFDYLTGMDPAKSSTFACMFTLKRGDLKKKFGEGTSSRASITPSPPKPTVQTTASARSATAAVKKVVEAIHISSDPTKKKKKNKRKVAREPSVSSKRSRRALHDGPPLSGLFDLSLWVAKRIHFDLFTKKKGFVKGMTEEEASNMAFELAARSAMCMAFELAAQSPMCMAYAAEKKETTSTELQALQEKYDEAVKSNKELTLRLAKVEKMAEDDKNKANTLLAESCSLLTAFYSPKTEQSMVPTNVA